MPFSPAVFLTSILNQECIKSTYLTARTKGYHLVLNLYITLQCRAQKLIMGLTKRLKPRCDCGLAVTGSVACCKAPPICCYCILSWIGADSQLGFRWSIQVRLPAVRPPICCYCILSWIGAVGISTVNTCQFSTDYVESKLI